MIKVTEVKYCQMEFEKDKPLPLCYLYTLLGQEYQVCSEEPDMLEARGENPDDVLDILHIALNGFPEVDDTDRSNNSRIFTVRYKTGADEKIVRVVFYIDGEMLCCSLRRAFRSSLGEIISDYKSTYHCSWDLNDLEFYGLIDDGSDIF